MNTPSHANYRYVFSVVSQYIDNMQGNLPQNDVGYPFAYISEARNTERQNSDLVGTVRHFIHIYCTPKQRSDIDKAIVKIRDTLNKGQGNFGYYFNVNNFVIRQMGDNTDIQPLIHFILEVDFLYTKKGE